MVIQYENDQLKKEVMEVAKEIASKDPDALTACKEAYHYSLQMSGDAAINYAAAKSDQLSLRQSDSWRSEGIGDFLQGADQRGDDLPAALATPQGRPGHGRCRRAPRARRLTPCRAAARS